MNAPDWMNTETWSVEHCAACPSPYLVRLCAVGMITYTNRDAMGYGKTLYEAMHNAMARKRELRAARAAARRNEGTGEK